MRRPHRATRLGCGSREWNPQQWTPLRNAPPRVGTKDAHLDPNRYGMRTVDAAGGSATEMAVRFAVRARHSRPMRISSKCVVASSAAAGCRVSCASSADSGRSVAAIRAAAASMS